MKRRVKAIELGTVFGSLTFLEEAEPHHRLLPGRPEGSQLRHHHGAAAVSRLFEWLWQQAAKLVRINWDFR